MNIGKLTKEEVIELALHLRDDVYSDRNRAFLEDERLYDLDFRSLLNIPKEYIKDSLVLSTGRDMVDTFCNHTNISNASVKATKKGEKSKKTNEEEKMERHFGNGVIYMTNLDGEVPPWWDAAKHYWTYGMAVMKTLYIADLWPNKPSRKKGESDEDYSERLSEWAGETGKSFPIKVMSVSPYNVYPDPDPNSTDFVIEINNYNYTKAKARYPFWSNPNGRNVTMSYSDQMVDHISFWSANQHMEIVDGESVIRTKGGVDNHGYGLIPYVIFNSGLGILTHDSDMSKRYVGILRYIKDLLIAESASFSVNHIVLKKAGWPMQYLKGENASVTQIVDDYGVHNVIPEGVELMELQHAVPPREVMQNFAVLHNLLAEHGAPRSMQGIGEEGVRSGADRRLLLAEGTKRMGQAEQAFKNRTAKVLENCARIYKNVVPGNVRVWSRDAIPSIDIEIDKKKMKEPFNYSVEFSPISAEDEYRRHDDKIRLKSAGIYDNTKIWEEMPGVDVDDMEERMERQRLMDSPAINQAMEGAFFQITQAALAKRLGSDAMLQQTQPPMGGGKPQQPMGGMTTNIPNRAPIGSAQEQQNQLKNLRSPNAMTATQGVGGGGERGVNR